MMTLGCSSRCPSAELPSGVHSVECKGLVRHNHMTSCSTLSALLPLHITFDLISGLFIRITADSWQLTMNLSRQGLRFQ